MLYYFGVRDNCGLWHDLKRQFPQARLPTGGMKYGLGRPSVPGSTSSGYGGRPSGGVSSGWNVSSAGHGGTQTSRPNAFAIAFGDQSEDPRLDEQPRPPFPVRGGYQSSSTEGMGRSRPDGRSTGKTHRTISRFKVDSDSLVSREVLGWTYGSPDRGRGARGTGGWNSMGREGVLEHSPRRAVGNGGLGQTSENLDRGQGNRGRSSRQDDEGTSVVSAYWIQDLDGKSHMAETKKDIKERMNKIQGLVRVTSTRKQGTILRDLELRTERIYATLKGKMHGSHGDMLDGFEDLHRLPGIWDTNTFKSQETLEAFYHFEGFKKWDWRGTSLASFRSREREIELRWGQDADRGARALLITCVKRLEATLVVLFDREFEGTLEPLEELLNAAFIQHANGFLRFQIEDMIGGFMVCVREEKVPDVPGYGHKKLSNPTECAALLRAYSENLMFRLGSKRYGVGEGPQELLEAPPHNHFFGSEGPWAAVVQPSGGKPAVVSPPPKKGTTGKNPGESEEIASLKRALEEAQRELSEARSPAKVSKPTKQEICLDFLAGEYGVTYGTANTPWACRLGQACPRIHPKGKEEGWKLVRKAEWLNWPVASSTKSKMSDLVPQFDGSWA